MTSSKWDVNIEIEIPITSSACFCQNDAIMCGGGSLGAEFDCFVADV